MTTNLDRAAPRRRALRYLGYVVIAAVAYAVIVRAYPGAEWLAPWLYLFSGYLMGRLGGTR